MQTERMGFLYKLYCLGWRNGAMQGSPALQYGLLKLFLYYRRGFEEGVEWRQEQCKQNR